MSNKNIELLREHLFAQMADLRATGRDDPEALKAELSKAAGVSELSKAIIDTAKVENDYLRITEQRESQFLGVGSTIAAGNGKALPNGIVGITRHICKDD